MDQQDESRKGALIVGVGPGLGLALGKRFAQEGYAVGLAARNKGNLEDLAAEVDGAAIYACDAAEPKDVAKMFEAADEEIGPLEVVVYNASAGYRSPSFVEIPADKFRQAWEISAFGGFLVGQEAVKRMAPRKSGTLLFTGATASIRGGVGFAAFAAGKFALRAIAQSMAREFGPQGIHVAHVIIDGGIGEDETDAKLRPDDIAQVYWDLHSQPRSAWSQEVDLRPWLEKF